MSPADSPIETESGLADEMASLLRRAHENGVDVEGGWECRNGEDRPDWDVVVTEVEKTAEAERTQSAGDSQTVDD